MSNVPSNLTFGEMEKSMPQGSKSALRKWYEGVQGGNNMVARAKIHAAAAGNAVRGGGEALLIGGLLGAMSVELPTGLDVNKIPIDAAGGVVALLASTAFAHEEFGVDLRNAGQAALSVFSYRKTQDLLAAKKKAAGGTPGFQAAQSSTAHGDYNYSSDVGADPIVAAAKLL